MKEDFDIVDVVDTGAAQQVPLPIMDDFEQNSTMYIRAKKQVDRLTKDVAKLRLKLLPILSDFGTESDGNLQIELPDEVMGVRTMIRQRRASKKLSERDAQKLLKAKGLYDQCTKQVTVLDEDAIMEALYDGELNDLDMDVMFPVKESFALVMRK